MEEMCGPSGSVYEGMFKNGCMHRQGTCRWADGDVYEGEYKNDKRHGQGAYRYASGDVYEGEWEDDERRMGRESSNKPMAKQKKKSGKGACSLAGIERSAGSGL